MILKKIGGLQPPCSPTPHAYACYGGSQTYDHLNAGPVHRKERFNFRSPLKYAAQVVNIKIRCIGNK